MSNAFNLSQGIIDSLLGFFSFLPSNWTAFLGTALSIILIWFLIRLVLHIVGTFI